MSEDSELLRLYAENHAEEAFAELVRRHVDLVYSAALRVAGNDSHLAEDVAQKVFMDLARKSKKLSAHPSLMGWLFTSTRFTAIQLVRTESRRRAREERARDEVDLIAQAPTEIDWNRLRPALDQLVSQLGESDRTAVLLRFFKGRTLAEVGSALGITEEGARSRVNRALEKMRRSLARRGIQSTATALASALALQTGMAAPVGLAASVASAAVSATSLTTGLGAGAWALANLMTTTKAAAGLAALALLALSAAIYQTSKVSASARSLVSLSHERDDLLARLGTAQKSAAQANAALATARGQTAQRDGGSLSDATSGTSGGALVYALDHNDAYAALLAHAALTVRSRFERFFRSAGLTGAQQDRFVEIAMDDAQGRLAVLALRRNAGGLGPNAAPLDPAVIAQMSSLQHQNDDQTVAAFKGLLGDQFTPAMNYLNTVSERNTADELASQLYYTDTPLTGAQAEQLVQVLAKNRFQTQGAASPANTLGGTFISQEIYNGAKMQASQQDFPWMADVPVTDAAFAQATSVLSAPQIAALQLLQARQAAELQMVPPKGRSEAPR